MINVKYANTTYAFILCVMLSLGLSFFGKNTALYTTTHSGLTMVLTPVFSAVATIENYSWWAGNFLREQKHLLAEIERLQQERISLNLQLAEQERLVKDVAQLLSLEKLKQGDLPELQTAQIISILQHANRTRMYINKGGNAGLAVGDVVFDRSGIVGQIESTNPFSSSVLLVTDQLHYIPVSIERTGERMIVNGSGKTSELKAEVDIYSNQIQVGDILVSSGLGGRFFRNYPVGVVKTISPLSNDTLEVRISPSAKLTTNEFVAIAKSVRHLPTLLTKPQ